MSNVLWKLKCFVQCITCIPVYIFLSPLRDPNRRWAIISNSTTKEWSAPTTQWPPWVTWWRWCHSVIRHLHYSTTIILIIIHSFQLHPSPTNSDATLPLRSTWEAPTATSFTSQRMYRMLRLTDHRLPTCTRARLLQLPCLFQRRYDALCLLINSIVSNTQLHISAFRHGAVTFKMFAFCFSVITSGTADASLPDIPIPPCNAAGR